MVETIFGLVIGAIISIATTILVEWLRKPRLKILIGKSVDNIYNQQIKRARFLYLIVANEPMTPIFQWLQRSTAERCHGEIIFRHFDGQKVFTTGMPIRWSDTPEPVMPTFSINGQVHQIIDYSRFTQLSTVDICAGDSERFDVAARFDDDEDCFGWNNENYINGWRNPLKKLKCGRYLVEVRITSAGEKCIDLFRLLNDVALNDFRIEKSLPEDWVKIKNIE